MIIKTVKRKDGTSEIFYSEITTRNHMKYMEYDLGMVLNELLSFDFDSFAAYIKENLETIERDGDSTLEAYPEFEQVSKETKTILIETTLIKTLGDSHHRPEHVDPKTFEKTQKLINYVYGAVDREYDSESHFRLYFEYYLKVYNRLDFHRVRHDIDILNYLVPVAYVYARQDENIQIALDEQLLKAGDDAVVDNIINLVPRDNEYYEIMQIIKSLYWNDATKSYILVPRTFTSVVDAFEQKPELQYLFFQCVYEYDTSTHGKMFRFRTLEEYMAKCILECYKNGYAICKCPECGKLYVRTSNSRKLCGSQECMSRNKIRSAENRRNQVGIDDNNIFTAVYKTLCYSKEKKDMGKYIRDCEVDLKTSAQMVTFFEEEIVQKYRTVNKEYKKKLKTLEEPEKEQALEIYQEWLYRIKACYNYWNVIYRYRQSKYYDSNSTSEFTVPYITMTTIENWQITEEEKIISL